ncbi:MAG TPA: phospholipase D family protein [Noviherbaspirillum sp.]|jgi:phosphatidylserine/phosphatidylglycerophosphate/cardiolipin synthase-like enzyme|uniref:phospholipase D family nuclease n=1 Tax=Noviherbaspirillum sp. TaxID=1926288 RepID=UPI002DDCDFDE|nr:phospholipase D family protein [Noviherbaspirillum sp.]HEV2610726.1 phospholipase D family protein [Noviherbaspirillum sp.]
MRFRCAACFILSLCAVSSASARQPSVVDGLQEELRQLLPPRTAKAPASAEIETGFSPDGDAERLVLKTIDSATKSVRLAAYAFTSPKVVQALLRAKRRGVDVRVVADNSGPKLKSGAAALNLVAGAGIPTRLNGKYAIHHDKYVIVDGRHVQTGSFNYSQAAAKSNSENVIVIWHNPELAAHYLRHWESRFEEGTAYRKPY